MARNLSESAELFRRLHILLVSVVLSLLPNICSAQQQEAPSRLDGNLQVDWIELCRKVLQDRSANVTLLRKALRNCAEGNSGDTQRSGIADLLGDIAASEAAEDLVKIVAFTPALGEVGEPSALARYPAAHALARIGVPAHSAIFKRLRQPANDDELKLFAYVLSAHAGSIDASTGQFYISRRRAHKVRSSDLRKNLNKLEVLITSQDFGGSSDWPRPNVYSGPIPQEIPRSLIDK
ncbi:MAG: hypothetical protein H8E66_03275 [Planctomycetes bacterium]|nr:hypothetical protein [Planctomycetota bacterium]